MHDVAALDESIQLGQRSSCEHTEKSEPRIDLASVDIGLNGDGLWHITTMGECYAQVKLAQTITEI